MRGGVGCPARYFPGIAYSRARFNPAKSSQVHIETSFVESLINGNNLTVNLEIPYLSSVVVRRFRSIIPAPFVLSFFPGHR